MPLRPLLLALGLVLLLPKSSASAQATEEADVLRVRLLAEHAIRNTEITAEGGPLAFFADDNEAPIARLEVGETADVRLETAGLRLETSGEGFDAEAFRIEPLGEARARLQAAGTDVPPRLYEGVLSVRTSAEAPAGLLLIGEVELEAYVAAVLAGLYGADPTLSEEPGAGASEGAKAVAVAVRTYALFAREQSAGAYDLGDDVQAYEGAGAATSATQQAALATRGEVLMYRDRPIEPFYFASSGGHTANNEDVWGGPPRPYLRGRPDPYDASPYASWRQEIARDELLPVLSEAYGLAVSGIRVGERSPDGRAATLELMSAERDPLAVRASDVRQLVGDRSGAGTLPSTLFDVERVGERFVFAGRGAGHGVGLPLWSAREQARQGRSYTEILASYYTDVALGAIGDDLALPLPTPPTVAQAGRPPLPEVEAAEEAAAPQADNAGAFPARTRFKPSTERKGW